MIGVAQDILFEQLEDDQLDLDLHAEVTPGLEEILAKHRRAHGVALIIETPGDQRIQTSGQLPEGQAIATEDLGDHCIQRDRFFQLIIRNQCQFVVGHRRSQCHLMNVILVQSGECLGKALVEAALDVLALEPQVAHGFEEGVLIDVVQRPVGHFEQRVVGIIEQRLQALSQLQGRLVADLNQNHGQTGERRRRRSFFGGLVQRHDLPVIVHPSLPLRFFDSA